MIEHMSRFCNHTKRSATMVVLFLVASIFSGPCPSRAEERTVEYKIKAAYLYNFLKFVWWPESALTADTSTIAICLLGPDPLAPYLEPMTQMKAQGRAITITTIDSVTQARDCQLLFIGNDAARNLPQIMQGLKEVHALTVGEAEGFAAQGGMIGFTLKGDNVALEINTQAAQKAELQISAKLLEVAEIVR